MSADTSTRHRLVDSLHLEAEPDGGAHVVDDRTFSAAHVNASARIVLEALRRPRTREDLQAVLAEAAECTSSEAAGPVAQLLEELMSYGWIEEA
ncbi:PqqD family protein [Streptomyces sp. NPDC002276]